jgi:4-amino-4-deoxy-L-arabinose transferase-like glycosyltransferase
VISRFLYKPVFYIPVLIAIIFIQRLHCYHEPMDRDMGDYAVIAHEIIKGESLYDGFLMDQKPPMIHWTCAFGELLFGYGRLQIYLLGCLAATITVLGTLLLRGTLGADAAFWGAVFWVAIGSNLRMEANQPNSEAFINAWMMLGLGLLFQKKWSSRDWMTGLLAGICFAMASLYKHSTVIIPMMASLGYIMFPIGGRNRRKSFVNVIIIGLTGVLFWSGVILYFGATGRLHNFISWVFVHNQYYAGSINENIFAFSKYYASQMLCLLPLFILSLLGVGLGIYRKRYHELGFILFLTVGTSLAVALPGKFFPHYYQLWFPALIISAAFAVSIIDSEKAHISILKKSILVCILLLVLLIQWPLLNLSAKECSNQKYGYVFINTELTANYVNSLLKPDESFFQIGDEPEIYFETKRRPNGPIAIGNGLQGPMAAQLENDLMKALNAKPDLILVQKYAMGEVPGSSMIWKFVKENYSERSEKLYHEPFYLLVRKNSNLERRLGLEKKPSG